ncbi:MAG: mandelate racemase/muconate lactonizing enzyme family protein [Gemmatimonadetes bacterium]|jgi:L-Ala-D/L-Glu epimerase|nr:mandelate racemase/muconate lactonizing enzyme family protein [Gemmatimonadota bacterium]
MKITSIVPTIVSVPYSHRETSSRVQRDGVTAVVVQITTDDGLVGWGESCPGPNVESIYEVVRSAASLFAGRDPWERDAIAADFYGTAHWYHREMTGHFAFAGIDMALNDLCGKAAGQPLYNLFGGLHRADVDYFCYLAYGPPEDIATQARTGLAAGYRVFYLKVGIDFAAELAMVGALRQAVGPEAKIRIDANGSWTVNESIRYLAAFDRYHIDFVEQPVWPEPVENMVEVRSRQPVAVCANEGLWRVCDVHEVIKRRAVDTLCFSSNWVGTLAEFHRLSWAAHREGLTVCRHTHGELGLMAAASHHVCLSLPNLVDGNQQVAAMMADDILQHPLPIATGPTWGIPEGVGLCVEVDREKLDRYHELYRQQGQFLPYQADQLPSPRDR